MVTATANHPFWVVNRGVWIDAGDLRSGDLLHDVDGQIGRVTRVRSYWKIERVYNLTVEAVHT